MFDMVKFTNDLLKATADCITDETVEEAVIIEEEQTAMERMVG